MSKVKNDVIQLISILLIRIWIKVSKSIIVIKVFINGIYHVFLFGLSDNFLHR